MTVQELFQRKSTWTRGTRARDMFGLACNGDSPNAVAFCLLGALDKCYRNTDEWVAALIKLQKAIEPSGMTVVEWNDNPGRTFKEVRTLIKKAGV